MGWITDVFEYFVTELEKQKVTYTCVERVTPKHVAFECGKWVDERRRITERISKEISLESIAKNMLKNKKNWEELSLCLKKLS